MKNNYSLGLIGIFLLAGAAGCGGGGSPGSASDYQPTTGNSGAVVIESFPAGSIKDGDAGAIARSAVTTLVDYIDPFDPDEPMDLEFKTVPVPSPAETSETINCPGGGKVTYSSSITSDVALADDFDNFNLPAKGDWIEWHHEQCQDEFGGNPDQIQDGVGRIHVHAGYGDISSVYRDGTITEVIHDRVTILFGSLVEPNYLDGAITTIWYSDRKIIEGNRFASREAFVTDASQTILSQTSYTMEDFSFEINRVAPASLTGSGLIGSSFTGYSFQLDVVSPLTRRWQDLGNKSVLVFESGAIVASGISGQITIEFFDGYFSYRLDANDDGDYESSGDIFWADIITIPNS